MLDSPVWVTPFLAVGNPATALDFYEAAFGFHRANVNEEEGRIVYAELVRDGATVLMLTVDGLRAPEDMPPVRSGAACPAELVLRVADADEAYGRCLGLGALGVFEPKDVPWGQRLALIVDADGYRWLLTQVMPGG